MRRFAGLERDGRARELERERRRAPTRSSFVRQIDLRYVGQSYELTIPAGDEPARALPRRARPHVRLQRAPAEPVEVVSLRLTSVGTDREAAAAHARARARTPSRRSAAPVYFAEAGGYVDCPIYDRYALRAPARRFAGPAVVEEFDSTTVVHPGYVLLVDDVGQPDRSRRRAA